MGNDSWKVGELFELLVSKLLLNISFYSLLQYRDSSSVSQIDYQYNPQHLPVYLEQKSGSLSLCPVIMDTAQIWDPSRLALHHILVMYLISTNFSVFLWRGQNSPIILWDLTIWHGWPVSLNDSVQFKQTFLKPLSGPTSNFAPAPSTKKGIPWIYASPETWERDTWNTASTTPKLPTYNRNRNVS